MSQIGVKQSLKFILESENDYINANYIQMDNDKGINRKWIAAQGPLPNTVQDFYQMIWERSV